jgi:hypothetical protein
MQRMLLTLVLTLSVLVGSVYAQDVPMLSDLEISLWPEFDRPEVLIIYRGSFAGDTPLPMPVEIRIPARVGQPTAVAYVGEGGQRFNQEHATRVEGDWLVVSFELPTLGFQLEYYDTLPVDSAGQRTYEYAYTADYAVTALSVEFQVPPTAEDFVLEPPADSVIQQSDGLTYHLIQAETVEQDDTVNWMFTYRKPDSDLTVSAFVQPETPVPVAAPAAEVTDNSTVWIFLVAFVALIAVGAAAFWLGGRTQPISQPTPPLSQRQRRRGSGRGLPSGRQSAAVPPGREAFFCHQCGAELRPDSEFCHKCGTAVRTQ